MPVTSITTITVRKTTTTHTHTQANAQLSFQESKEISRGKQIIEN